MKRLILYFFILIARPVAGQDLSTERILLYEVDLTVDTSSVLTVTEKIRVNAMGQAIQRGIYRSLPLRRMLNGQDVAVRYYVRSVRKNGEAEKYHTKRESGSYVIYLGDKNVFLSPGIYDYEITYDTDKQIGFFDTYDELYWNATGTDWVFPIDRAVARITLPQNAAILQHACYTGTAGSTARECNAVKTSDHTLEWSTEQLGPLEGLTVAASFTKGVIRQPEIPALLHPGNLWKILAGVGAFFLVWMGYAWNRFGRDHPTPTAYPRFEVPGDLSPAGMGFVHYEKYRENFITASLISLAVKGYITIHEIPKKGWFGTLKYTLQKRKDADSGLRAEEVLLMRHFFSAGKEEVSIDGKYDAAIGQAVLGYRTKMADAYGPVIRQGSNLTKVLWIFLGVTVVYWGLLVYSYQHIYEQTKLIIGALLYVGAAVTLIILMSSTVKTARRLIVLPLLFTALVVAIGYYVFHSAPDAFTVAYLFLMVGVILLAIFNYLVRQPSPELLAQQAGIEGFKMYLEAAESQLLKFHNPPEITPALFEKYLPYALVLGVDGIWGKKFEQHLQTQAQGYQNHWYTGTTTGHFSANMTSQLSRSLGGSISSSSVKPGSGGSGGGGSSGGGGGGGGGGGW